ncbi:hypothetical protein LXL04_004350 [Taraxacum kok-saghyz]
MRSCVFIIFSFLLLLLETATADQLVAVGAVNKNCSDVERRALLDFKAGLQDPEGALSTWTAEDHDCCSWLVVICNNQRGHNHVTSLIMSDNKLHGTIPKSIGSLTELEDLDLSGNSFYGTIPKSIGSLTELKYLDLSDNSFYETIPKSIGSLTELKYLDLSNNSFYGTIPLEFGNLTKLQHLNLDDVGICRVENPEWLSHLSHLVLLNMNRVSLAKADNWVDVISSLPNLTQLSLDGCELSQVKYPNSSFLNSSSSIQILSLENNNLTSSMYRWLVKLTNNNLFDLDISSNRLDGIPTYFGNLCNLNTLQFDNNFVAVKFSDFLNNLSGCTALTLHSLFASKSHLTGSLSDNIQKFSSLTDLNLYGNQLTGIISEKLWELRSLYYLNISSNYLSAISKNIGKSKLSTVDVSKNISGELPDLSSSSDGSLDLSSNSFNGLIPNLPSYLKLLNLSRNKFYGGISFLCQYANGHLHFLDLSYNDLTGPLPDCLSHFKELIVLNLGNNNLSGRLPPSIGSLIILETLHLYKNNFYGELPLSLKNCRKLNLLNLGANKFSGNVPLYIGENLSELYALILGSNKFFGSIPLQLCQLANLQILDLSRNDLFGTIPSCLKQGLLPPSNIHTSGLRHVSGYVVYVIEYKYVDHAMIEWKGNEYEFIKNLGLLKSIDLSCNNLTGEIPYEVTNLHGLNSLNLSNNALFGEIPQKIGELKQLEALDLSRNNLSGVIPSSMSEISSLSVLNLSYNSLSGRIPSGTQLQGFDDSHYTGNPGLCGLPVNKICSGDEDPQGPPAIGKSKGDVEDIDELWVWFFVGGGSGFVTGFWIACGTLLFNRLGRRAFYNFYDIFRDWVYVKVVLLYANFKNCKEGGVMGKTDEAGVVTLMRKEAVAWE